MSATGGSMSGQVTTSEGDYMTGDRGAETEGAAVTVTDVHREVVLSQLQVAREALYQALLWSILPAGQGSVLTGPQAESLAFAKNSAAQLQREVFDDRRGIWGAARGIQ